MPTCKLAATMEMKMIILNTAKGMATWSRQCNIHGVQTGDKLLGRAPENSYQESWKTATRFQAPLLRKYSERHGSAFAVLIAATLL